MKSWKNFPRFILFLALLTGLLAGISAPAFVEESVEAMPLAVCPGGIITQWTFLGDVTTPSTGSGGFANGSGVALSFAAGIPDRAISFTGWTAAAFDPNDYVEFSVDTTGRTDIGINFDYRSTGTGPNALELHYSTDGASFTLFSTVPLTTDATFHTLSFDLSSIFALNNNPNAKFRLYAYGGTTAAGNLRLDNVTMTEICIPPTPTDTLSPTPTLTPTNTSTPSATSTPTNTLIFSLTPTRTPIPNEVVISEVAWFGTIASSNDEWIELYNPRSTPININGWTLSNTAGSVNIVLNGTIPANGFFLLERSTNNTVRDVPADQIYNFPLLLDTGDILSLKKDTGVLVDTANSDGGTWPAGFGSPNFFSMERVVNGTVAARDNSAGWITNNNSATWTGLDANNNPIHGTPGTGNWSFVVTPTATSRASGARSVLINEVAWAGTWSSLTDDEWIELYNPGSVAINITNWTLKASDGEPNITLNGSIPARGYFLLERGDDTTVKDIPADQIYTGNVLSNNGEKLTLSDASGKAIDTANGNGGSWPKGSSSTYGSMERIGTSFEGDSSWKTNTGAQRNGLNANGGAILGTPRKANSQSTSSTLTASVPTRIVTRTATIIPPIGRPILNEILPRPGFDWNQDGKVDVLDEFIEIKNVGNADINMQGWRLDDKDLSSSSSFTLPNVILKPGERVVFYGLQTNLHLSDGGETVRLLNPSGGILDAYTYSIAKVKDESICRLPDTNIFGTWFEDCTPSPNLANTRDGIVPSMPDEGFESSVCDLPDTLPDDFLFAECRGYGANIWDSYYWDKDGWQGDQYVPENMSKWESFVE